MKKRGPTPGSGGRPREATYYDNPCPVCYAAVSQPCVSKTGARQGRPHKGRLTATPETSTNPTWTPGQPCIWMHTPRKGYGYTFPIAAKVVAATENRAKIEVYNPRTVQIETKSVHPESLRPAPTPLPPTWPEPLRGEP